MTTPRLSFFACQKDVAGAVFFKAAPSPVLGSGHKKIGSSSTLKVAAPGGSGSATLILERRGGRWAGKICKGVVTSKGSEKSALA